MASAQKKQQSISNFFKKPSSSSVPPPTARTPLAQRSTDGTRGSDEEDFEVPAPKRQKRTDALEDEISAPANGQPVQEVSVSTGLGQLPSKVTPRTSRYLFSSQTTDRANGELEETLEERRRKEKLHDRFVKKLGKPDSIADIKRRNRALIEEETGNAEGGDEDTDDEPPPEDKPKGRKTVSATKKGPSKLTPMEKQVLEIKRSHMDTLLVVEVGYKFRFFGEDARIAAKELSIVCIPGKFRYDEHPSEAHLDRFASASIPTHRLHVHVKRLVAAGHKVGVVRQLETAALKAAGDNRNAPFVRKLTNLYTKGTYIDDVEGIEESSTGQSPAGGAPATGFILGLTETNAKGWGNDEKVQVGFVAVQPATGEVIYDDFEDGFMRSDIETRLLHVAPCEFLIVGELSKATEKLVQHLSSTKTTVFGDKIRVERVSKDKTMAAQAFSHISSFYADKMKSTKRAENANASDILDKILKLPEHVTICLSAMITHMQEYGLEHVFDLTKYFQSFSARSHMLLNGNTLNSLEIYQNQTDHTVKGSLLWALDRTQTRFGQRLLRKWVGRPLLDRERLEERLVAVEELSRPERTVAVEKIKRLLIKMKTDLEKSLIRIYYGKCSRPELVTVLQSLQLIANEYALVKVAIDTGFESTLLSSAIMALPSILPSVISYLGRINMLAAKEDDKYAFFLEGYETEDITEHKLGIASVEHELSEYRTLAAQKLGKKTPVNYATVAGIDYLIEVENSSPYIKWVPASWTKISATKKLSRFHPPEIVTFLRERDQHKESLAAACDTAFAVLLSEISTEYQSFRDCISSLATLDSLLSLATVAQQPGYVKPTFTATTSITLTGARHPMVEQLLLDTYVPNSITLSHTSTPSSLLITGPNMGGKSSYVRSVALISIMAQIGSFVPCDSAELGLLDAVYTRMGAFDNMMKGESTFMVELSETADILKGATERSLVILDELGRGTSTNDGVAIAGSVLDYLVREKKCLTLFITHYQNLANLAKGFPNGELKNVHMKFEESEAQDRGKDMGEITFLYEVGEGVAHRSYGLNVARLAGLNESVLRTAAEKSRELEDRMKGRMVGGLFSGLSGLADEGTADDRWRALDVLVEGIEQL